MKKTVIFALFFLPHIFLSCGLDTIIFLEPVKRDAYNDGSVQEVNAFVSFNTSDKYNSENHDSYFKGFEIYYKIYERSSERSSDESSINKYNEDNPAVSAKYLLETKKYHRLAVSGGNFNDVPLIKKSTADRLIKIRLIDFAGEEKGLYINNTKSGIPRRSVDLKFDAEDIENTNEDVVKASSNTDDENWYINFYAAAYGNDDSYKPLYSQLTFLGYLMIKKKEK